MRLLMAITKALADRNRVRLVAALEGRELCVCQLIELIGLAPSTVSKHLSILRAARLLDSRKNGRWTYYRLRAPKADEAVVANVFAWLFEALRNEPVIAADRIRLVRILAEQKETSSAGGGPGAEAAGYAERDSSLGCRQRPTEHREGKGGKGS